MKSVYATDTYFKDNALGYADYQDQQESLTRTFRRLVLKLDRTGLTGGSLLDVGCGYGYLLHAARGYYDRRVGIDLNPAAVEEARHRADAALAVSIDRLPHDDRFDCIVTTNVIEHMYSPERFVTEMRKRLRPGGRLLIATPNMGSFWRRLMGHRWPSFKVPEHIVFFDRTTLTDLMTRAGLTDIRPIPFPHAFPVSLVAAKLRLMKLPSIFDRLTIWLPGVMVALHGTTTDP